MYHERLITGVAVTLGVIALVFTVVGLTGTPVALPVALAFAASAVLMYDQLSGRMAARVYRRVERHARVEDRATGDAGRGRRRRDRRRGRDGRGGFGAGPREEWTPPRDGATMGEAAAGGRGGGRGRNSTGARSARAGAAGGGGRGRASAGQRGGADAGRRPDADDGPTAAEAYRRLGVDPGADEETIKQAYRERVKEVHPDTADGDEEAFMAVKAAYERLTD